MSASNATSEKEQGTSRSEEIPTDMSHIFGPLHQVIQILSEISNQNKKSEQFTVFAHHVAAQLEQLPLEDSLMLQSEIQNLITAKRVKLLRDQTRHT
ncbi:hypothetical protein C0J52_06232 [Blattella germanica]|nr:hypothetical protein C0J52_06232 [Blattella germanica]